MITTISYFSNDEGVWEGSTPPPVRKLELGLALQFLVGVSSKLELGLALQFLVGVSSMSINHN